MTVPTISQDELNTIANTVLQMLDDSDEYENGDYQRVRDNEGDYDSGIQFIRVGYEQVTPLRFIPDYFESFGFESESASEIWEELQEKFPEAFNDGKFAWTDGELTLTINFII